MSMKQHPHAPGLSLWRFFKSFPDFRADPLRFMSDLTRRYGHVVSYNGLWTSYQITHPRDIERVLQTNSQNYRKGRSYQMLRPITGNGLLISDGELWRRQRRLAQPAFQRQRIGAYAETINEATASIVARWRDYAARGQAFDVTREMMRLTLHVIGLTMFGTDLTAETDAIGRSLDVARAFSINRMWQIIRLPMSVPLPSHRAVRRALAASEHVILGMIATRRSGAIKSDDLLSRLVHATDDETGARMDDEQLRAEAVTFLGAGHDSTAAALTWLWYLLAQHEEASERLRAELKHALDGRAATIADLSQLTYTTMAIEEAMRLYPPAWIVSRTALGADRLGDYDIAAGSEILIPTYVTHRHPDFWAEPDAFDPERFTPEQAATRPRFAYFPFGAGPRQCIGNHFALMEMQLIIAQLAQHFRLRLVPGQTVEADPSITLRPRNGVQVTAQEI